MLQIGGVIFLFVCVFVPYLLTGGSLGVLFRPECHRYESSPAALRLLVSKGSEAPRIDLLKVQGGRPGPVDFGEP